MPRVSVVMTVLNEERFLSEAIESILRQTYEDFDFIIIDDGSTDNTPAILKDYQRVDSRIKYVSRRHNGIVESLIYGCRLARGDYIARMDADDIAFNDRFEKQLNFFNNHSDVAVLGGQMIVMDEEGKPHEHLWVPTDGKIIKRVLFSCNTINQPTVMMLRDAYNAVGGYRTPFKFAQDYDLWLRMIERYEFANLKDYVHYYRLHPNQVSIRHLEQQALCGIGARLSARARREMDPDPMEGIQEVTREILLQQGASTELIKDGLLEAFFWQVRLMLRSNAKEIAAQILKDAQRVDQHCYERFGMYYGEETAASNPHPILMTDTYLLTTLLPSTSKHLQNTLIAGFYLGCARYWHRNGNLLQATRFAAKAYSLDPSLLTRKLLLEYAETSDPNWDDWLSILQERLLAQDALGRDRHAREATTVTKSLDADLRSAMLILVDVFAARLDLQKAFPEVLSQDHRRLLEWANGVAKKRWEDGDYETLKKFAGQFERLLRLDEIVDPAIRQWLLTATSTDF